jgi:hypothetical protein
LSLSTDVDTAIATKISAMGPGGTWRSRERIGRFLKLGRRP